MKSLINRIIDSSPQLQALIKTLSDKDIWMLLVPFVALMILACYVAVRIFTI